MHCDQAKRQLRSLRGPGEIESGSELMRHLQACPACREAASEQRLLGLLADLPAREPRPGLEDRVLNKALDRHRPATGGVHYRWAAALAASVVLAVLVTLQFYPSLNGRDPAGQLQFSVVEVVPQQTRMVNVMLNSPRSLDEALITVELDDNLALEGYRDVHNLRWRTSLKRGSNRLSLPVQLLQGQSGRLTVTVEHEGARKRFSVQLNAAPAEVRDSFSMV